MTIEEFDNYAEWFANKQACATVNDTCETICIVAVDLKEALVGYVNHNQLCWKRCENVTLITTS